MTFKGKSTNVEMLTIEEASVFTRRFQDENPDAPRSYYFDREFFDEILADPECVGFQVYLGSNSGNPRPIIAGMRGDGTLIPRGPNIAAHSTCPCRDRDCCATLTLLDRNF